MIKSAEIIAIGSELLTPNCIDTNSLFLTERLNSIGIEVEMKTIVGDNEAYLEQLVRESIKRSSLVISTGGLGPTDDDLTRPAIALALGDKLVRSPEMEPSFAN